MNIATRPLARKIVLVTTLFCMATQTTFAALLNFANVPLFIGANVPPLVMLNIGRDHQLHYKAYTDYSDLDEDGVLDITYKHSIDYYGYFDSYKCYTYNGTYFVPEVPRSDQVRDATDPPTAASITANNTAKYCTPGTSQWSGNFLNWVAMTRIDTVRKLLFGGLRSTDNTHLAGGQTMLERNYLPADAHAFAKYYSGRDTSGTVDIDKLTPYGAADIKTATTSTTSGTSNTFPATNTFTTSTSSPLPTTRTFTVADMTSLAPLDYGDSILVEDAGSSNKMKGRVIAYTGSDVTIEVDPASLATASLGTTSASWRLTNLSQTGISFCNVTNGDTAGVNQLSQTNTNPPLLKVAKGNFALWNSMQRFQCMWQEDGSSSGATIGRTLPSATSTVPFVQFRWNGNLPGASGLDASAGEPSTVKHRLGGADFIVRVEACRAGRAGQERCKQYPDGNLKPVGLLQEYGDTNQIYFGLMTGSYARNVSGGVLRKNPGSLNDEINVGTDGTFKLPLPANGHIIATLNRLRMYGYDYGAAGAVNADKGSYQASDGCIVAAPTANPDLTASRTNFTEGTCSSWGNPMSEIYLESLRYFAGTMTANFGYTNSGSKDAALGLPQATWADPLNVTNYCAPLNVLNFNAAVASYDGDQFAGASSLAGSPDATALTNAIGGPTNEAINGGAYFVGKITGAGGTDPTATDAFEVCTAKTVPQLGDARGICSEAPAIEGSYLMAGLAHYARTTRIRPPFSTTSPPPGDTRSFKVTTYGITLSSNIPQIRLRNPASLTETIAVILPAYRAQDDTLGTRFGSGTLVDFKVVPGSLVPATGTGIGSERGAYYVNWEVSQQGADFDADAWGVIRYCVKTASNTCNDPANGYIGTTTSETTGNITITTDLVNTSASGQHGFGYIISGTTRDGAHYHSGSTGWNYVYLHADGNEPECASCQVEATATAKTYTRSSTPSAGVLPDPLQLAAKYGAFADSNPVDGVTPVPDLRPEWDSRNNKTGQPSLTGDGIPDTYFLVTNPLGLVAALDRAFISILAAASASSVATNSSSLQTNTAIYQARFNANDWTGQLKAFAVGGDGAISSEIWDSGFKINAQADAHDTRRTILTYNPPDNTDPATYATTAISRGGVPFRWTSIPTSLQSRLNKTPGTGEPGADDGRGQARLNWIRGSTADAGGTATSFRERPVSRLGDIINSNPNFVAAPNGGFGDPDYATFRNTYRNRPAMIYVGANDGMLHGFLADSSLAAGEERLAYIPSKVHHKLNALTSKLYVGSEHKYFVDGSPEIGDAKINIGAGTQWYTVLVSGMAAGGQGVFALNITSPTTFAEADAASIAMWEFTDADDPDMGYVFGQPAIRLMANGRWAAIVSSGYNNSENVTPGEVLCDANPSPANARVPANCTTNITGSAYLFIIYLDGPGTDGVWTEDSEYIKIRAQRPGDSAGTPNGLTQPFPADVNADGFVDFIYAGDLFGRLWKFDVRLPGTPPNTSDPATAWKGTGNQVVLFTAKDPGLIDFQPITAKADGTLHPNGGFIIVFGTGKYLETSDPCPPLGCTPPGNPYQVQSFYGIWDKDDATPISGQSVVTSRSQLVRQGIFTGTNSLGQEFRVLEDNTLTWSTDDPTTPSSRHMGWHMDFEPVLSAIPPINGERSPFRPILTSGRLIFTTLVPSVNACEFGGTSFLMIVNPITGGRFQFAVLDTESPGVLDGSDVVSAGGNYYFASGVQSTIGITPTPTIIKTEGTSGGGTTAGGQIFGTSGALVAGTGFLLAYALAAGSSGDNASTVVGLGATGGRVSWRELMSD